MPKDIGQIVRELLEDEVGVAPKEITDDTKLLSSGMMDSFTLVTLLTAIDEELGVTVDQSELTVEAFDTITNIRALVARHLG